jgi:hypothetical protein
VRPGPLQQQVQRGSHDRRAGIELPPSQDQRDFGAEHVPHHATRHAGDGAHEHRKQARQSRLLCDLGAADSKERQPTRVRHEQPSPAGDVESHVNQCECRCSQNYREIGGIGDPEDGTVQEHVAQGAAAGCGHDGDNRDAEPVQFFPAGGEDAADGEDGDAQELNDVTNRPFSSPASPISGPGHRTEPASERIT